MEQDLSLSMAIGSMVDLQRQTLNELKSLNSGRAGVAGTGPASGPYFSGREQIAYSPYSMYSPAAQSQAMAAGTYMPGQSFGGIALSPNTVSMANATANSWQKASLSTAIFGTPRDKFSQQQRDLASMQAGQNLASATMSGLGTAASFGVDAGLSALLGGGIGGLAGGAIGGVAAGAYFTTAAREMQTSSAYSNYLFNNSYRFINPAESNNTRYGMGFTTSERSQASTFLRHNATNHFVSDQDMQTILSGAVDQNLLSDVTSLKTFKDKLDKLTGAVKTGALMLNESYKNIVNMMGELERAGVSSSNFDYMMGKMKVLGSYNGASGVEVTQSVVTNQQSMVQGTTLNPVTAMNNAALDLRIIQEMGGAAQTGSAFANYLANAPGETTTEKQAWVANRMSALRANAFEQSDISTLGAAFFDYNSSNQSFALDSDLLSKVASGQYSAQDIASIIQKKSNSMGTEAMYRWSQSGSNYLKDLDSVSSDTILQTLLGSLSRSAGVDMDTYMSSTGIGGSNAGERNIFQDFMGVDSQNGSSYRSAMNMKAANQLLSSQIDSVSGWWIPQLRQQLGKLSDAIGDSVEPFRSSTESFIQKLKDSYNGTSPIVSQSYNGVFDYTKNNLFSAPSSLSSDLSASGTGVTVNDLASGSGYNAGRASKYSYTMSSVLSGADLSAISNISKYSSMGGVNAALTLGSLNDLGGLSLVDRLTPGSSKLQTALLDKYSSVQDYLQANADSLSEYDLVTGNQALQVLGSQLNTQYGTSYTSNPTFGMSTEMRTRSARYLRNYSSSGLSQWKQDLEKERDTQANNLSGTGSASGSADELKQQISRESEALKGLGTDLSSFTTRMNGDTSGFSGLLQQLLSSSTGVSDAESLGSQLKSSAAGMLSDSDYKSLVSKVDAAVASKKKIAGSQGGLSFVQQQGAVLGNAVKASQAVASWLGIGGQVNAGLKDIKTTVKTRGTNSLFSGLYNSSATTSANMLQINDWSALTDASSYSTTTQSVIDNLIANAGSIDLASFFSNPDNAEIVNALKESYPGIDEMTDRSEVINALLSIAQQSDPNNQKDQSADGSISSVNQSATKLTSAMGTLSANMSTWVTLVNSTNTKVVTGIGETQKEIDRMKTDNGLK